MSLTKFNKNYKHMSRNDSYDDADISNSSAVQTTRKSERIAATSKLQITDDETIFKHKSPFYSLPDDGKHIYNNVRLGISSKRNPDGSQMWGIFCIKKIKINNPVCLYCDELVEPSVFDKLDNLMYSVKLSFTCGFSKTIKTIIGDQKEIDMARS